MDFKVTLLEHCFHQHFIYFHYLGSFLVHTLQRVLRMFSKFLLHSMGVCFYLTTWLTTRKFEYLCVGRETPYTTHLIFKRFFYRSCIAVLKYKMLVQYSYFKNSRKINDQSVINFSLIIQKGLYPKFIGLVHSNKLNKHKMKYENVLNK